MPIVDTREPKTRSEPLRRAGWILKALHYGDYLLNDALGKIVLIEQKTVSKLVADMRNGVLVRQCRGLVEHSDFPILLIEGHWVQDANGYLVGSNVTWEQAWNQLQTIQDIGCRLQLTTSINHTVERLFELEAYYKKEKHDSALRQISGDPFVVTMSLISGIDETKAKRIEECFRCLGFVVGAGQYTIMKVPGVGEVLAKRIHDFFWTDYAKRTKDT